MELGVSHVQNLSSLTASVDNIFDKYNKNLVPIRSFSDHDRKNRNEFVVHTDNNPLTYVFSSANLDAAGQQW